VSYRPVAPDEAAALRADGLTLAQVGERFGVSRQAVHQALRKRRPLVARLEFDDGGHSGAWGAAEIAPGVHRCPLTYRESGWDRVI
jgi:hypothetical protein